MTKLEGQGNVVMHAETQTLTGNVFEWDPTTASGTLTGTPASMRTPTLAATAENIFFDQRTDRIVMTGNAAAELELRQ